MSADIIPIRPRMPIEQAWDEYSQLMIAMESDPSLKLDRRYVEATLIAWKTFRDLYLGDC